MLCKKGWHLPKSLSKFFINLKNSWKDMLSIFKVLFVSIDLSGPTFLVRLSPLNITLGSQFRKKITEYNPCDIWAPSFDILDIINMKSLFTSSYRGIYRLSQHSIVHSFYHECSRQLSTNFSGVWNSKTFIFLNFLDAVFY